MCESLHLPVQSGSDSMLRRMGRQYTIEHYLERLARIRAAVPGISLSTDVIVGFCGETEDEYEATLDLLRTVRFDQVFAAAYSERPGTPATRLADDVPGDEKRRRLVGLLARPGGDRSRAEPRLARPDRRGPGRHDRPAAHARPRGGRGRDPGCGAAASRDAFARPAGRHRPPGRAVPREQARPRRRVAVLLGGQVTVVEHAASTHARHVTR